MKKIFKINTLLIMICVVLLSVSACTININLGVAPTPSVTPTPSVVPTLTPEEIALIEKAEKSNIDQAAKNAWTEMIANIEQEKWDDMVIVYSKGDKYYEYQIVDGVFTQVNKKTVIVSGATVYTQTGEPLTGVQTQANATGVTYVEEGAIARNIAVIVNP